MKQFKIDSMHDFHAVNNQIRLMIQNAFERNMSHCFIALSQESFEQRSNAQNRLMWPLLTDISDQVEHFGMKLSPDDWKHVLTAAFENDVRTAPSLNGDGVVMLGYYTSKYTKKKMTEFIEFIYATGSERGVEWSDKSQQTWGDINGD